MAEAQGPEGLGEEEKPFDIDPDLIDAEDDGGMGAVPQEPQEKRRGRPPKKPQRGEQSLPGQDTRHRAFVESNVKTALAKTDMSEVMNRYDWESGDYDVAISRIQPQTWHGRNIQGYIAAFPHLIDEHFIGENFGGGVYDLKIRGPNPRQGGAAKGFLDGCRVKISGDPKLNPMDRSLAFADGGVVLQDPQAGPPSQRQMAAIRGQAGMTGSTAAWEQPGMSPAPNPDADSSLVKMGFNMLAEREKQSTKELASMRERLIDGASSRGTSDSMAKEAIQLVKESADRAIEAERLAAQRLQDSESKHREDVDRMMERMNNQKTGIPPEMLQTLTEQHRSELATAHQAHVNQITQSQERHEREINSLRERYERELTVQQERSQQASDQIRGDLQARLDRLEEQFKREQDRERERYQGEVVKMREESDRRTSDLERDHKSRFDRAQEDWQRRLDTAQNAALQEREASSRSQQMQIDHLKALHDGQISQERSQRDSLMAQIKSQHEASMKIMETSYATQIDRLTSELDRARSDLDSTRAKVTEQGDLASQAEKLKRIGDSLGSVFGMGAGALANVNRDDTEIEPHHQEDPKTWFGKLMQFANTDMGAGVWDFLKVAMASAAGGAYPPGSVPMMPQQPNMYGPQGGYPGTPPGYGPVSYAPPHSPYASGPMQPQQPMQYQQPGSRVENPEDEYEEVEEEVEEGGEGDVHGSFVDEQAEPAGPAPETPPLRSPVRPDGAVTQTRPPAPVPVRSPSAQVAQMAPAEAQQLRVLVKGLEDAMANGINPIMMAQSIAQMAPREQLGPFANTPIEQLIAEVSSVSPESQLTSYSGRKFLSTLQQHVKQLIG
jgi:hypothetical protein